MFGFFQKTTRLAELTGDVDMTTTPPANGEVPVFESASGKWKPGAGGGGGGTALKTPDGTTDVEQTDVYPVKAYGASGSARIFRCTTSGSTVTTTANHDFEVGHSLVLLRAGANCSVTKPAVANGSLTPGGTPGSTTYRMCFSAGDGNGGWTGVGASDYVETTTGAATITETNYIEAKIPVPYGAPSVAVYFVSGTGAISTYQLVTVLEVRNKFLASGSEPNGGGTGAMLAATIDSNGGFVRLTVASGHGFSNGDVVNFKSIANTEYNAQHVITGNTATTLTTSTAYGSATASGYYQPGYVTYRYKGVATALHDTKGLPLDENSSWDWRASIVRPRGNLTVDTAGARLYRSEYAIGGRKAAAAEPTWPAADTSIVADGDHTMRRSLDFVPVAPPAADIPGALFTTVATAPTPTTVTLTDAPTNAIASNTPYLLAHNDAPAWRAAFAAAEASGRGGTITADGIQQMYFRKHTLDTNMSNVNATVTPIHAAFRCRSGVQLVSQPAISVKLDPHCVVRAHYMQCDGLMEDLTGTETSRTYYHLFHFGGERIQIEGGAYEWNVFSGGLTEHECTADSHAQAGSWCYDQGNAGSINLGTKPQNTLIADCRVDWPNIGSSNGYAESDSYSYRKMTLRNVQLHYGGSDGDQTFSTNHGDFDVIGGEIWNTRRLGSHGLYFGVDRNRMRVIGTTFKEVAKNSFQMRGSTGGGYVKNVIVSGCIGVNTGPILVGDSTSSNRVHNVSIANCIGFNVTLAEARNVSIVGGVYGTIGVTEDVANIKISELTCDYLNLASTDLQYRLNLSGLSVRQYMYMGGLVTDASVFDGINFENPHAQNTVYNGYTYEWVATGSNNEYYCRLRATGGNPGISSPTAMRIRENITNSAGTLGSLGADTWYYGDPGALGYSTIVVKINDSTRYNPDENTWGEVASLTMGPAISWGAGTVQNTKLLNISIRKTLVAERTTYFGNASASAPGLVDVQFGNCTFEHTGLAFNATGTVRMVDWGTAVMPLCERVEFFKCKWLYPRRASSAVHSEVRMAFTRGGSVTFRECEMPCWGSGQEILAPAGSVHLIDNRIQSNEAVYTSATGDTFTHLGSGNTTDLGSSTSDPVMVRAYGSTALPVSSPQITVDTVYYRNNSTLKLYLSAAAAAANTNPIDITTANGPVLLTFLNSANLAYMSSFEFLGDTNTPDIYGIVRGNIWRGSPAATYAQIASNQNNYQLLPLVNEHLISTDASRTITGINAPGAGGVSGRRDRLINVGTADAVFAHEEVEEQTIAISGTPTGGSFTVTHTGGTTGSISHSTGTPATAATVQTALRLVPGLSLVTVTQSGAGTDLTFTVAMKGWNSDPAQMTSTSSLTGGAPVITHATTVAYTSEWFNRFLNHTSADVTLAANNACELDYDGIQRANRLFAY